jgi:hypothetical protein
VEYIATDCAIPPGCLRISANILRVLCTQGKNGGTKP